MKKKNNFRKIICGVLCPIMLCVMLGTAVPADAVSSEDIKKEIDALHDKQDALNDRISQLESQKNANASEIRDVVQQKINIEEQVVLIYQTIANIEQQVASYNQLIADQQDKLEAEEARLAELNAKYKERIRAMEEGGGLSYWEVLFSAGSFMDFLDKVDMIAEIAAADRNRLEEISRAAEEIEKLQASLVVEREALRTVKAEQEKAQEELEAKSQQAQKLMEELLARGEEYQNLIQENEASKEALFDELAAKNEEYDKKVEEEEFQKWLEAQNKNPSAPLGGKKDANGVYWAMPTTYYSVGPFGPRFHPILHRWKLHNGIDLSNAAGTPIYASRSGLVMQAASGRDNGNFVRIDHGDGYRTVYLHMSYFVVSEGQQVEMGQLIGYMGSSGLSSGPHLHFSIIHNGVYENPAIYLDF